MIECSFTNKVVVGSSPVSVTQSQWSFGSHDENQKQRKEQRVESVQS